MGIKILSEKEFKKLYGLLAQRVMELGKEQNFEEENKISVHAFYEEFKKGLIEYIYPQYLEEKESESFYEYVEEQIYYHVAYEL